ncbi:hypothetical protein RRF57_010014 [Xylaria bambusicola]|uniref:Uncharacterized protein n=1 Tax=Xylaria bambusicola TaxID=326684 RepID=A0AAN7UKK3_9PEZI
MPQTRTTAPTIAATVATVPSAAQPTGPDMTPTRTSRPIVPAPATMATPEMVVTMSDIMLLAPRLVIVNTQACSVDKTDPPLFEILPFLKLFAF